MELVMKDVGASYAAYASARLGAGRLYSSAFVEHGFRPVRGMATLPSTALHPPAPEYGMFMSQKQAFGPAQSILGENLPRDSFILFEDQVLLPSDMARMNPDQSRHTVVLEDAVGVLFGSDLLTCEHALYDMALHVRSFFFNFFLVSGVSRESVQAELQSRAGVADAMRRCWCVSFSAFDEEGLICCFDQARRTPPA